MKKRRTIKRRGRKVTKDYYSNGNLCYEWTFDADFVNAACKYYYTNGKISMSYVVSEIGKEGELINYEYEQERN
jgi:antitoxin component YwqK of YwqJK toxin-antitoxin module